MKFLEAIKTHGIVWIWNHTPTCSEMSRLASRSLDQPLSLQVWFKMRLHYLICVWCKRYNKQVLFLHRMARQLPLQMESTAGRTLSPEARQRILNRLQAARDQ